VTGGLSGPAIRPISVRMVWETVQRVSIPVIGIGGIITAADALQYLIAGARAVQIGTGLFVKPDAPLAIVDGLQEYLRSRGRVSIHEIIGCLRSAEV
jgi:dihydroorotate dehydrogenase (NAD+) catalytic subunit